MGNGGWLVTHPVHPGDGWGGVLGEIAISPIYFGTVTIMLVILLNTNFLLATSCNITKIFCHVLVALIIFLKLRYYFTKTEQGPSCITNLMPIYYIAKTIYNSTKKWCGEMTIQTPISTYSTKIQVDERKKLVGKCFV